MTEERIAARLDEQDAQNLYFLIDALGTENKSKIVKEALRVYGSIVEQFGLNGNEENIEEAIELYIKMEKEKAKGNRILSVSKEYEEALKKKDVVVLKEL